MNLRPRQRQEPDINLTPLIDVVFLLLIFFMVSTTFLEETDFKIDLPKATQGGITEERGLEVVIDAAGHYFVNGRSLADARLETLKQALTETAGEDRRLPLVIRADAKTPHQAVVTVMDAAAQSGFGHLAIATIQNDQDQAGKR